MNKYKIFASTYDSVEKMKRNKERDWALDLKTRTNYKIYMANSIIEAVEMFENDNVCDELDDNSNYYLYYLDEDGNVNNVIF